MQKWRARRESSIGRARGIFTRALGDTFVVQNARDPGRSVFLLVKRAGRDDARRNVEIYALALLENSARDLRRRIKNEKNENGLSCAIARALADI